jgi:hypothetical protein
MLLKLLDFLIIIIIANFKFAAAITNLLRLLLLDHARYYRRIGTTYQQQMLVLCLILR